MRLKVGQRVYYRSHSGKVDAGTVIQIGGGPDGDLTEVRWHRIDQALWLATNLLFTETPNWPLNQPCVCGCPFGDHSPSGCITHQIHIFTPQEAS